MELPIQLDNRMYIIACEILLDHLERELNRQHGAIEMKATLYITEGENGIIFSFSPQENGNPIPWSNRHDWIRKAMRIQYEKYGKVYIYTTRDDNYMAFEFDDLLKGSIYDPNKHDDLEDVDELIWGEQQEDLPMYIGFD